MSIQHCLLSSQRLRHKCICHLFGVMQEIEQTIDLAIYMSGNNLVKGVGNRWENITHVLIFLEEKLSIWLFDPIFSHQLKPELLDITPDPDPDLYASCLPSPISFAVNIFCRVGNMNLLCHIGNPSNHIDIIL